MDWKEIAIYTTTAGIEPVAALLMDHDVESYALEDAADFQQFLEDTEPYWDYIDETLVQEKTSQETCLKFYLPEDCTEQLTAISAALAKLKKQDTAGIWGRLAIETNITHQEEWEWGWKKYFKPFPVGKTFFIKPSWETLEDTQGRYVLEIDPASSFGTGSHDTTQLCIAALEDTVQPRTRLLDMGTGSGILSIAAAMLGAQVDTVVDIDANCLKTAQENAEKNHITIGRTLCGDALRNPRLAEKINANAPYDMITANIVADIIIKMSPFFAQWLRMGGVLICSGILDERAQEVQSALEVNGFSVDRTASSGGWTALTLHSRTKR